MTDDMPKRQRVSALLRDLPAFLHLVREESLRAEAGGLLAQRPGLDDLAGGDIDLLLADVVSFSMRAGIGPLLALHEVPNPTAEEPAEQPPARMTTGSTWTLLGRQIGFPVGVPASNQTARSDWAIFYARKGHNVLTYRTVRSRLQQKHPQPNLVFLPALWRPLVPDDELPTLQIDEEAASKDLDLRAVTTAHSFGVPSPSPQDWQADVARIIPAMASDQILIVAVLGTSDKGDMAELRDDFIGVSRMAEDVGATAIELNLHCSLIYNRSSEAMVPLCEVPSATIEVVSAVRRALRPETRLVLKLGYLPIELLKAIIEPLASKGRFDAISGINPVRAAVETDTAGTTVFFGRADDPTASRLQAGVSGVAIQKFGLRFVRSVAQIRRTHGFEFDIIAMGGVMDVTDVSTYFALGANAVQTATASLFYPDLAAEASRQLGAEIHSGGPRAEYTRRVSGGAHLIPDAEYELFSDLPVRHAKSTHTIVTGVRRAPQTLLMGRNEFELID